MKSPYVAELQASQSFTGTFLVTFKDVRQKKSGDPYLSLTLADRTGDIEAKMWDNAAEVMGTFERDAFVKIKGLAQLFQNKLQVTIQKLQPVADSEVDIADFYAASKRDRDEMFRELQGWIAGMVDPHLKALAESIFGDPEIALAYRTAPAAKTVHHGWLGGLIEHILSMCELAKFTAAHYSGIDFDLLLTGVLLHDIGKIRELNYARGINYSDEGQLIGHISIGIMLVNEKIRALPEFPPKLRDLVLHMILSHHGEMEFGSPKVPMFAEAILLHHLDNMDSKMEHARSLMERDPMVEGTWSGYSSALNRSILKKNKFLETSSGKPAAPKPAPVERPIEPASVFGGKLKDALGPRS